MDFRKQILTLLIGIFVALNAFGQNPQQPKIAFSFDDGQTVDLPNHTLEEWNGLILSHLAKHKLKAILFSAGKNKKDEKGQYVLSSWNDGGHLIANHTINHLSFGGKNGKPERFSQELLGNDSIIRKYSNYVRFFRFPYLKEGNSRANIDAFRKILKQHDYRNGHVSIDASDWYIDQRLVARLKENPSADVSGFREFYKQHLLERATFYDSISFALTGRRINHVILLHHNLAAALFLDDLIAHFKANGWKTMNADDAYKDPIYESEPQNVPEGESLIWALAKQSGKFEKVLRYPAEDSEYEKPKMDKLGL